MSTKLSRRRMILAGGAALAVPIILAGDGAADAEGSELSVSDRSVSVVAGTDSRFDAAVETLYPGLTNDPMFREIVPLSILITHQRGPGIRAFSVIWSVITARGTYTVPLFYYHAPGSRAKHKSVSTLGSARKDILQAGDSVLVTPFFNWMPEFYRNNPNTNLKTLLAGSEPGAFLLSELRSATALNVSVDGIVFSDWKRIGPDANRIGRRLKLRRNAERDEGLAVHRMLKAGASDSDIAEMLTGHASALRSNASNIPQRLYEQARRFHAQVLLRHFQNADRVTFNKALHRLVRQRKIPLVRATS